jgi:hypothetical protein
MNTVFQISSPESVMSVRASSPPMLCATIIKRCEAGSEPCGSSMARVSVNRSRSIFAEYRKGADVG